MVESFYIYLVTGVKSCHLRDFDPKKALYHSHHLF